MPIDPSQLPQPPWAQQPPLANAMQPQPAPEHNEAAWGQYLQKPEVQAGLMQFGISMLSSLGSRAPLGAKVGHALGDASGAAYRGAHPELNPQKLQAQRLQIEASKPYWDAWLQQQGAQSSMDLVTKQAESRRQGEAAQLHQAETEAELRARLQAEGHSQQLSEIDKRTAANLKVEDVSNTNTLNRQVQAGAIQSQLSNERQALEMGMKMWETSAGAPMSGPQVDMFQALLKEEHDNMAAEADRKLLDPKSPPLDPAAMTQEAIARAYARLKAMSGGTPHTTVVAPLLPTGPMPPVQGP